MTQKIIKVRWRGSMSEKKILGKKTTNLDNLDDKEIKQGNYSEQSTYAIISSIGGKT
jgi:hypothetical protein